MRIQLIANFQRPLPQLMAKPQLPRITNTTEKVALLQFQEPLRLEDGNKNRLYLPLPSSCLLLCCSSVLKINAAPATMLIPSTDSAKVGKSGAIN